MWNFFFKWSLQITRGHGDSGDRPERNRSPRTSAATPAGPVDRPPATGRFISPYEHQTFPAITDEMVKEYALRRDAVRAKCELETKPPSDPTPRPEYKPTPGTCPEARPRPQPIADPCERLHRPGEIVMAQWFPQVWFYSARVIGRREGKHYVQFLHCSTRLFVKDHQVVRLDLQVGDFVGVWLGEVSRYGFVTDVSRAPREYLVEFQYDERHDPPAIGPAWVNIQDIFADLWDLPPRYRDEFVR